MYVTLKQGNASRQAAFAPGQSLLEVIRSWDAAPLPAPCGGAGKCGKCTVTLENGDRVLACQTPARAGMVVTLPEGAGQQVLLDGVKARSIAPDADLTGYGIACDIGTTTVVCQLIDLPTGQKLAVAGQGNRQQSFGADVISRIQAAGDGQLDALTRAITGQLSDLIGQLCRQAGISPGEIGAMTVAANTTMCHLLTGLNPEGMGHAPFEPVSRFGTEYAARALGLPFDGAVYISPAVSGYVGGDITADLMAIGLADSDKPMLLIDVGTNGEMALGCGEKILCCSTAAGPAFEGAQISCGMTAAPGAISAVELAGEQIVCRVIGGGEARGICGSGLIDAIAVMLDVGALDETGRLPDPEEDDDIPPLALRHLFCTPDGSPAFRLSPQVFVTQADVRKVQLGKGAIAAGEQVLMDAYGASWDDIGALCLAGGFGSFIRPESAARIGLIPRALLSKTVGVGNTAAEGARMALISAQVRTRLSALAAEMQYLELSGMQAFNNAYMDAMLFPEQED